MKYCSFILCNSAELPYYKDTPFPQLKLILHCAFILFNNIKTKITSILLHGLGSCSADAKKSLCVAYLYIFT